MLSFTFLLRKAVSSTLVLCVLLGFSYCAYSHESKAQVTYLANEGIMADAGEYKVLFDPFFHNDYGFYQLVPDAILAAIMSNAAPYNNIDAIFVSHAHGDHFAAQDMLNYLQKYSSVKFIAPSQAIEKMALLKGFEKIQKQLTSIGLEYGDKPISLTVDKIEIDAVRIPHSGWPGRAEISNIVFRITLPHENSPSTYVHMGDADPNDAHFRQHTAFWQKAQPDIAFPPYWFFSTLQGNYILDTHVNATQNIGVHVPLDVPKTLKESGKLYFSSPGEKADVVHQH